MSAGPPAGGSGAAPDEGVSRPRPDRAPRPDHVPRVDRVPRPATGPDSPARTQHRQRMLGLAGVTVHGSDGRTVGRVRDVYLEDATGELAAITVMPRQLSARSVLIPAVAIASLPQDQRDAAEPDPSAAAADPAGAASDPTGAAPDPVAAAAPAPAPAGAASDPAATAADDPDHPVEEHVVHLHVDSRTAKAGARPPLTLHATPADLAAAVRALHLEEGSAPA